MYLKKIIVLLILLHSYQSFADEENLPNFSHEFVATFDTENKKIVVIYHKNDHLISASMKPDDFLKELEKAQHVKNGRKTPDGFVDVENNSIIKISQDDRDYEKVPILPPIGGQSYSDVHRDLFGNYYVVVNGNVSGFNYYSADLNYISLHGIKNWQGFIQDNIKQYLGNPLGSGLIAIDISGRLLMFHVDQANEEPQHTARYVSGINAVEAAADLNGRLIILKKNGDIGLLNDIENIDKDFEKIDMPDGVVTSLFGGLYSSRDPHQMEKVVKIAKGELPMGLGGNTDVRSILTTSAQGKILLSAIDRIITDEISNSYLKKIENEEQLDADAKKNIKQTRDWEDFDVKFRDREASKLLESLMREKAANPVLLGKAGVGKTALVELAAKRLFLRDIPEGAIFQERLRDAIIIETSPHLINTLNRDPSNAITQFLKLVEYSEELLQRPVLFFIDELHRLSDVQIEELKTYLDRKNGPRCIGSTTFSEYSKVVNDNPAIERRFKRVDILELNQEETFDLIKSTIGPRLAKRHKGKGGDAKISDSAIEAAIKLSVQYTPDLARPDGPYKLLNDVLIWRHARTGVFAPEITADDVGDFVVEFLDLPFNPVDQRKMYKQIESLELKLNQVLIDQSPYSSALFDSVRRIYLSDTQDKSIAVVLAMGPTGAGKTFGALQFAKIVLGDENRMLEVDATKFSAAKGTMGSLIGVGRGVVSGTESKGLIPDFLSGPGKGANVIVINEIDKASTDFLEIIMELMDTGKLQGGNGQTFYAGKSIIILTTNKGSDLLFPKNLTASAWTEATLKKNQLKWTDTKLKDLFNEREPDNLYENKGAHPSVLERIQRAVAVLPPSIEGAAKIGKNFVLRLTTQHQEKTGIYISLPDSVIMNLLHSVYLPRTGIRSVVNGIERLFYQAYNQILSNFKFSDLTDFQIESTEQSFQLSSINLEGQKVTEKIIVSGLQQVYTNPLLDTEGLENIRHFEEKTKNLIVGQDEVISAVSDKLVQLFLMSGRGLENKRPSRFLFLGSTGTGKTATAETIATEYFGNLSHIITFDLSSVSRPEDFNEIFGSKRGFVGSDSMPPFERFLVDNPDGGVILFDEIGNIGSGTGGIYDKTKLLQVFYQILDKGKWMSPLGKVYDLSSFILVFTSNELQEVFANLPNDDLREAAWHTVKKEEDQIRALKNHGWPEALIGRFAGSIFTYRPLTKNNILKIAKLTVMTELQDLMDQYKLNVIFADQFFNMFVDVFYSHTTGARSLRSVAESKILPLLTKAILQIADLQVIEGSKFTLALEDNFYGDENPEKGRHDDERLAKIVLRVEKPAIEEDDPENGRAFAAPRLQAANGFDAVENAPAILLSFESDIENLTQKKLKRSQADLFKTAIHEAGHVVGNDPKLTGLDSAYATIEAGGEFYGYARNVRNIHISKATTRPGVIAQIGKILAGREAERIFNLEEDAGWMKDWSTARELAVKAIVEFGLTEKPLEFKIMEDGKVDIDDAKVQSEIKKLLEEGRAYVVDRLNNRKEEVKRVADYLMKNRFIEREQISEILGYELQQLNHHECFNAHNTQLKLREE